MDPVPPTESGDEPDEEDETVPPVPSGDDPEEGDELENEDQLEDGGPADCGDEPGIDGGVTGGMTRLGG